MTSINIYDQTTITTVLQFLRIPRRPGGGGGKHFGGKRRGRAHADRWWQVALFSVARSDKHQYHYCNFTVDRAYERSS